MAQKICRGWGGIKNKKKERKKKIVLLTKNLKFVRVSVCRMPHPEGWPQGPGGMGSPRDNLSPGHGGGLPPGYPPAGPGGGAGPRGAAGPGGAPGATGGSPRTPSPFPSSVSPGTAPGPPGPPGMYPPSHSPAMQSPLPPPPTKPPVPTIGKSNFVRCFSAVGAFQIARKICASLVIAILNFNFDGVQLLGQELELPAKKATSRLRK